MNKLKVMTLIGTRPEIIKLSRVISVLDNNLHHILVHSGQNYDHELNEIFFNDLKIREPDYYLNAAKGTSAETIGKIIIETDKIIKRESPDAFLILGDTNSCFGAISAKKRKVPIFHMESGNRCFDGRVPEEVNRKLLDHLSDINMPYTSIARDYLLSESISPDRVIKIGSPMLEVLEYYKKMINDSNILHKMNLDENDYFVVSCHREENIDSDVNFEKLIKLINFIGEKYKQQVIFTAHPRTQRKLKSSKKNITKNVKIIKPLGFTDYIKLQVNAKAVLSDSGTITEESSILNFPAINIREAHERPEGMEEAAVMMTGMDIDVVSCALSVLEKQERHDVREFKIVNDYDVTNVSGKVLRIIISYTNYVNRNVWRKII